VIVLKFGGSSVRDAQMIRRVLQIASARLDDAPVLISSAMGKTTDALVFIAAEAAAGNGDAAFARLAQLRESHLEAVFELTSGQRQGDLEKSVHSLFDELSGLAQGVFLIRECSNRSSDAMLSFGERLSTAIIAGAAAELGIPTELIDARTLIRTDDSFGAATPNMEETKRQTREALRPRAGTLIVSQGFIARTAEGVTTTLGRGGSDYTATILGAALEADSVEIWTDVNGIMTADPRIIAQAKPLPVISYDEAAELAYFGAKVVHPSTIRPAVEKRIPVIVRNTTNPEHPGTRIEASEPIVGVRAIASKDGIALITVESSRMLNAYGFLHALFEVFDQHGVSVDLVATSEVSVSMTVEHDAPIELLVTDLRRLGEVSVERKKSIICIVGQGVLRNPEFLSGLFASLADIPVRMISQGSSDINLSLVIPEESTHHALERLHTFAFAVS
jgi:aspartate kinase